MKFDYLKILLPKKSELFGSSILKPIIPIRVRSGDKELSYAALIDSGADFCIFDSEVGEQLGLDIHSGQKENFGGIQSAGKATAFIHEIKINIGGWDYKTKVGFSSDIAKFGYGILGQKGFFDLFTVKFDLTNEEIEIKEKK